MNSKLNSRFGVFVVVLFFFLTASADEGMWTMYNLPDAVFRQMQAEGYALPKSSLYRSFRDSVSAPGALSACVVNFGGFCTGEVVSPNGLVLTNHHCGFEAVRSHSTVEHDYILNGFYAKSYGEELPNEDLFVAFMRDQRDITPLLDSLGIRSMGRVEQEELLNTLTDSLTREARRIDSTYYVEIDAFYEGNVYYATTYQSYDDVRLVYSPPKSLGKFGGETDNWMWPRQTHDISVFRIYVNPSTGGPAAYSPDNVPMQTADWLRVSTDGYRDGDFAMTVGYPGSTERYSSSYGIEELRHCYYDPMQQVRGVKQQVMKRHMEASEAVRIKYDTKFAHSSNYWKNAIGMNKCIDSIGIISLKREYEKHIQAYADSVGIPLNLSKLRSYYDRRKVMTRASVLFSESFSHGSQNVLTSRAMDFFSNNARYGSADNPRKQYVLFEDDSDKWDEALDCEALAALIDNYRTQILDTLYGDCSDYLPVFYTTIDNDFGGDSRAYVSAMWRSTMLMRSGVKLPVKSTRRTRRDLGLQFGKALIEVVANMVTRDFLIDSIREQERLLCLAKVRMEQDMPHYSDANFTMRLSYGQVGGYAIGGYDSGYYTTAPSFIEKAKKSDFNEEYFAEPVFHELLSASDYGVYTDSVSRSLNLCFLTNNDITGGNSGSPVINGRGELVGLAFDGNWDSLSADIYYDAALARCINVDIRYILYIMKTWAKADRLLEEMGIEK